MFVLATLGFLVILILSRQITSTSQAGQRITADDLAQAGIRYAFAQLRFSEDGADWRPLPPGANNVPIGLDPNFDPENPAAPTPDPDYYWMRQGGPDDFGPFTRLNYEGGRALVRVRWAPSDPSLFQPGGVSEQGRLKGFLVIESVGRPGAFNPNDPTQSRQPNLTSARQLTALASVGVIEHARFVTNKDNRNQPVDFGSPTDFGSNFLGVPVKVPTIAGGDFRPSPIGNLRLGSPMWFNASLRIFGDLNDPDGASGALIYLNESLGDQIAVVGDLLFQQSASALRIVRVAANGTETTIDALPSTSSSFTTAGGVLLDSRDRPDAQGYPRSTTRKEPPLVDEPDPNTGQLRYRLATRGSGSLNAFGINIGRFGYGRGVYVDNREDLNPDAEDGTYTQRYDWLNPGKSSWWQGPFYVPPACIVELLPDGFRITRDGRGRRNNNPINWRNYDGSDSGRTALRFKIGNGSGGVRDVRIINELTPGVANFSSPSAADFDRGALFNGLITCEGNVRVRGVIQPNLQLTIVSFGTGYVDGSIVKGNEFSSLGLLCRDYVAINTTQFFRPDANTTFQVIGNNQDPTSPPRVQIDPGFGPLAGFRGLVQFPLNPLTGNSFLQDYSYNNPSRDGSNPPVQPSLWVAHNANQNRPSYINMLVNEDRFALPEFLFEGQYPNFARFYFPGQDPIPTYGLGDPEQTHPSFEKRRFQFWPVSGTGVGGNGQFSLITGGEENVMRIKLDSTIGGSDYFFSRAAIAPQDIRIEAALYAQEGSFFVIPGPWFNWNPNDRRDSFTSAADRLAQFNATVDWPFHAEPVDIRIVLSGAITENFPPVMADQSEWLRKWGWIPAEYGASDQYIPDQHYRVNPQSGQIQFTDTYVPNLFVNYDPVLISGRQNGSFDPAAFYIRTDDYGRPLPPLPKLPVGTKLLYFGTLEPR